MTLDLALDILIILLLIVANGLFSGAEIAIISSRRHRLEQLSDQGRRSARVVLRLADSPNQFLSTVQIGITLIGILTGAVGGASVARQLDDWLERLPGLAPYSEALSFGLVVVVITYLSVVVGELVPKRLALANPEQLACAMAPSMRWLARVSGPSGSPAQRVHRGSPEDGRCGFHKPTRHHGGRNQGPVSSGHRLRCV